MMLDLPFWCCVHSRGHSSLRIGLLTGQALLRRSCFRSCFRPCCRSVLASLIVLSGFEDGLGGTTVIPPESTSGVYTLELSSTSSNTEGIINIPDGPAAAPPTEQLTMSDLETFSYLKSNTHTNFNPGTNKEKRQQMTCHSQ